MRCCYIRTSSCERGSIIRGCCLHMRKFSLVRRRRGSASLVTPYHLQGSKVFLGQRSKPSHLPFHRSKNKPRLSAGSKRSSNLLTQSKSELPPPPSARRG